MTKTLMIDGKEVLFKASAAVPRIYRMKFGRDIFKDMAKMADGITANEQQHSGMPIEDLEMFENVAYVMAKHAKPDIPDSVEGWLDGFQTFSIYQILPEIVKLWGFNLETQVESKKKQSQAAVK